MNYNTSNNPILLSILVSPTSVLISAALYQMCGGKLNESFVFCKNSFKRDLILDTRNVIFVVQNTGENTFAVMRTASICACCIKVTQIRCSLCFCVALFQKATQRQRQEVNDDVGSV